MKAGMLPHQFPVFETLLSKRGRKWSWSVYTAEGRVVMLGAESSRASASYKAKSSTLPDVTLRSLLTSPSTAIVERATSSDNGTWLQ